MNITLQTAIIQTILEQTGEFSIYDITKQIRSKVNTGRITIKHLNGIASNIGHLIVRELFEEIFDAKLVPNLAFVRNQIDENGFQYRKFKIQKPTTQQNPFPTNIVPFPVQSAKITAIPPPPTTNLARLISSFIRKKQEENGGKYLFVRVPIHNIQKNLRRHGNFTCKEIYHALDDLNCKFLIADPKHHSTIQLIIN